MIFRYIICFAGALLFTETASAQFPNADANKVPGTNYKHAPNTIVRTADDTLVVHVKGSGVQPVILITDYMQDEKMFSEIVERHESTVQFHIAVPAGMGGTPAYAWPAEAEEFISRPWTSKFEGELIDYMDANNLDKPVMVTTWPFGMNAALHLAQQHPDKFRGVLIIGRTQWTPLFRAYPYNSMQPGTFDIEKQRSAVDNFIEFWRNVDTHTWFSNSFRPSFYSNDREFGLNVAYRRAYHEIPIMIRYWSEYIIEDMPKVIQKIDVPVNVISVTQSEERMQEILNNMGMDNLKASTVLESIHKAAKVDWMSEKENININFVEDSGLFVWHDKPDQFDVIFKNFLNITMN